MRQVDRTQKPANSKFRGRWTFDEDKRLREAVEIYEGKNWKKIASTAFGGEKTDVQCLHRWQKVLRPGLVKGPWTRDEDMMVVNLVAKYGLKKWSLIASHLKGRLGKQCRERWYNHLNPDIKKDAWSPEEDRIIISSHEELGNKWAQIAVRIPGRTDNAIKNRWNSTLQRLLKKQNGLRGLRADRDEIVGVTRVGRGRGRSRTSPSYNYNRRVNDSNGLMTQGFPNHDVPLVYDDKRSRASLLNVTPKRGEAGRAAVGPHGVTANLFGSPTSTLMEYRKRTHRVGGTGGGIGSNGLFKPHLPPGVVSQSLRFMQMGSPPSILRKRKFYDSSSTTPQTPNSALIVASPSSNPFPSPLELTHAPDSNKKGGAEDPALDTSPLLLAMSPSPTVGMQGVAQPTAISLGVATNTNTNTNTTATATTNTTNPTNTTTTNTTTTTTTTNTTTTTMTTTTTTQAITLTPVFTSPLFLPASPLSTPTTKATLAKDAARTASTTTTTTTTNTSTTAVKSEMGQTAVAVAGAPPSPSLADILSEAKRRSAFQKVSKRHKVAHADQTQTQCVASESQKATTSDKTQAGALSASPSQQILEGLPKPPLRVVAPKPASTRVRSDFTPEHQDFSDPFPTDFADRDPLYAQAEMVMGMFTPSPAGQPAHSGSISPLPMLSTGVAPTALSTKSSTVNTRDGAARKGAYGIQSLPTAKTEAGEGLLGLTMLSAAGLL